MGRRPLKLSVSERQRAELRNALGDGASPATRDRILVILRAVDGRKTLDDLADDMGRSRSTIQAWIERFKAGGVQTLLDRGTPPGSTSPVNTPSVQSEMLAGLKSGRWGSAAAVARWLKETHGIVRSRKSIYYWFAKLGIAPGPRTRSVSAPPRRGKSKP
jgi:transposase